MNDCPLYRAEHIAWAQATVFAEIVEQPQLWVDYVTQHEVFRGLRAVAKLPDEHVSVSRGAPQQTGCALARVQEQHIDLPPGPVSQGLLMHEVAHLCSPKGAAHDHRYCANYLVLVRHFFGELAATDLLAAMRQTGAFA